MMKIRKAVITAAGWGTRFLPATKSQPKEMLPLVHKPIIQYSVEEVVSCGMELVVIVTAQGKRAIEDHFDRSFELEKVLEEKGQYGLAREIRSLSSLIDIAYVRQKEQKGLGHALLSARELIGNEPFVLLLPDDLFEMPVLKAMITTSQQFNSSVIAVKRVAEDEISRYGVIDAEQKNDRLFRVTDLVEKPSPMEAPSSLAIMGRYVLSPEIFKILENVAPGRNGEIQLTDGLRHLARQQDLYAYEFEGDYYDAGTPLGWLETNIAMAQKDPDIWPRLSSYLAGISPPVETGEKPPFLPRPRVGVTR
jgi:UTP--glucose-1-phosphate uridylyltransferase